MVKQIKVGNKLIEISHEDKILFPKSNITKLDLVNYYLKASNLIIPFTKDRPLTLVRFPNGIGKQGFYQKNTPEYYPNWIKRIPVEKSDKSIVEYLNCKNAATLVYIANQGCITPHPWLSKLPELNNPDKIVFDLDPSSSEKSNFEIVKKTAILIKEILELHNLNPFVMTTGSKGLHVIAPIKADTNFDIVRNFAKKIAEDLVSQDPKNLTTEIRIEKRGKKIFIDYLRNAWSATSVCPYGVRPKENAPVATPIFWEELKEKTLISQSYNIHNVFQKLKTDGNPWEKFEKNKKKLNI